MTRIAWLTVLAAIALAHIAGAAAAPPPAPRPNILWITSEDNGPQLGCYGDAYARTPNLDALAARGMSYRHAWSNAPVCAPARTGIICGVYPTATGAEHMRSLVPLPRFMRMYPQYLRDAGYYCTNNSKEDYNVEKPGKVWDESSPRAHWRNRKPGQPFFAVFNLTVSHESQFRSRRGEPTHDPAKVRVPAYHPDTPEVRRDWARYYDALTDMDQQAGRLLREIGEAGLADSTIVFYYGDHGSGMPRSKRTACDSGLRVPIIIDVPAMFRHLAPRDYAPGGASDRLVSFVDLAPTLLSLAGVRPPEWMQGRAFMGAFEAEPPQFLHGFRGRMDERIDLVRTVTDGRYVYVRNYLPHRPHGQHVGYQLETPTTRVWKQLFDEGKLAPPQRHFWEQPRAPEELYDLHSDPDEVNNLAGSAEHRDALERLRQALREQVLSVRDVGFLPEGEIHARAKDSTPYEMGHDPKKYPLENVLAAADLASMLKAQGLPELTRLLDDGDSAVRYWAATGILMRGADAVAASHGALERALKDESPYVRVPAAEALGRYGTASDVELALPVLLEAADVRNHGAYAAIAALNAIDALGPRAAAARGAVRALPRTDPASPDRANEYVPRLIQTISAGSSAS
jgi:arylsulfatase A-like enzyme